MNEDHEDLVAVYLGTEVTAGLLKKYLLEIDVPAVIRNEHNTSIDKTGDCEVLIMEHDVEKTSTLIEEFKRKNP